MPGTWGASPADLNMVHSAGGVGLIPVRAMRPCTVASAAALWHSTHLLLPTKCIPYSLTRSADAVAGTTAKATSATIMNRIVFFPMLPP